MTASLQTAEGPAESGAPLDPERRAAVVTACLVGGVGCIGVAVPIVESFGPSEREKAAGGPVEVDISSIPVGQLKVIEWQGKPVWVLHRSPAMIESLKNHDALLADPASKRTAYPTPDYVLKDPTTRSIKPEFFVAVGICTHLGCSPGGPFAPGENPQLGDQWGFFCPCHGSTFDLAGRVFQNKPAGDNLPIPPYEYVTDALVVIGEHKKSA